MKKYLIWIIILVGLVLRIVGLNSYPSGFTPDEASFGYDAYSLLHTGRDQWGHPWPLMLESFGDFKPPLYAYILMPFVALFGLEQWVVRLPNALLGTAAIYVVYLLTREILRSAQSDKSPKSKIQNIISLPIIASAILAISPWHIMLSRGAFEANLTTFFMPLGIYLFLKGIDRPKYYLWSALIFGLNLFSYHSAKVVTPLIVGFLIISQENFVFNLKYLVKVIKTKISFIIIFSVFVGLMLYTFTIGAGSRVADINVFKGSLEEAAVERTQAVLLGLNQNVARVMHSKYQIGFDRLVDRYVDYFSPQFFGTDGPGEATYGMIPGRGVLYLIEIVFLLFFLVNFKKYASNKYVWLLLFWIAIAPLPASLTAGPSFSANRAAIMMPAIQIIIALGIFSVLDTFKKITILPSIIILLYGFLFLSYAFEYIYLTPFKWGDKMLAGNIEMAQYLVQQENNYDHIVVDKKLSEPHIYIAFARKFDPVSYQNETKGWDYKDRGITWVDQLPDYKLGKYSFKSVHIDEYKDEKNVLLVGRPEDFPLNIKPQKTIIYPSGVTAIYIIDPQTYDYSK